MIYKCSFWLRPKLNTLFHSGSWVVGRVLGFDERYPNTGDIGSTQIFPGVGRQGLGAGAAAGWILHWAFTAVTRSTSTVAAHVLSGIACWLLVLCLRDETEVTICPFFPSICAPSQVCWLYPPGASGWSGHSGSISCFSPSVPSARKGSPARF